MEPLEEETQALIPLADLPMDERVEAYINEVARYMEVNPRELVCKILTEWAYNRAGSFRGDT